MCAHQAACCWIRHMAQVARGRCSRGRLMPTRTTSSCARPRAMCRNPNGSNRGWGVCQNASRTDFCVTSAARAPSACPPMPSTTRSRTACSATAATTRSWFSSRAPSSDMSAYSTRKEGTRASAKIGGALYHPPAGERKPHKLRREHFSSCPSPMIASMTGFARREATGPWGTLVCELRSVNHRFLECSFRLPDEVRATEPELRQIATRELRRGKVDCSVSFRTTHGAEMALDLDPQALERVLARVREVAAALPGNHTVNVMDVLRWPGVVREDNTGSDEVVAAARALFTDTVADLAAARGREGVRLRELIEQRCTSLEGF